MVKMAKKTKSKINIFLIAILIIVFDQLTKFFIKKNMINVQLIKNFFFLRYIQNTGAAFGILKNQVMLLIWFSVIVIGVILFLYDKITEISTKIFTGFILGGTIGNLIDRLRLGFVVDFIYFKIWPAFNIADVAITIGVIGLILFSLRKGK